MMAKHWKTENEARRAVNRTRLKRKARAKLTKKSKKGNR